MKLNMAKGLNEDYYLQAEFINFPMVFYIYVMPNKMKATKNVKTCLKII